MGQTVAVTARSLAKGSNLPIDVPAVHADLSWTPAPGVPDLTAAALLLTADGQARDVHDLIRGHRPPHRSGAVLHRARTGGPETPVERIEADLAALDVRDDAVHRILLLALIDGDGLFAQVPDLTLVISDARTGLPLARFPVEAGRETALIGGELYRRNGQWKFRAVAQGWANGLAGLAEAYGFELPTGPEADAADEQGAAEAEEVASEPAAGFLPEPRRAQEPAPEPEPEPELEPEPEPESPPEAVLPELPQEPLPAAEFQPAREAPLPAPELTPEPERPLPAADFAPAPPEQPVSAAEFAPAPQEPLPAPEFTPVPPDATRELRLRLPAEPSPSSPPSPEPEYELRPPSAPAPSLEPRADATRELRLRPLPGPPLPETTQLPLPPMPLAPPPVPPRPAHAPGGSAAEQALPVDMRKRLSLRKEQVAVSLRKHGAQGVVARILLVLDASGSMTKLYERGVVADVVERMAAVAAQLDDDGVMQAWTFATRPARLPDLGLPHLPEWLRLHVRPGEANLSLFGRRKLRPPTTDGRVDMKAVGIQNEEQKVIAEVRAFVHAYPSPLPTLVLFFSDGGIYRNSEIEAQLRASVEEPIFWQFVGLGRSNYGVLERFDQLPGRRVDNVGFFAVDDISTLPDPELYDRLLSEFPQWITAARRAGILRQG
ncbi:VWA domain-containing protein [Kitasatospora sp. NPDC059795]|uniref:vWA domain-containing protein n=1 Tax=Kitasatospora sp. NPDC059795 TaxID=3346949 RepID=UPI0036628712